LKLIKQQKNKKTGRKSLFTPRKGEDRSFLYVGVKVAEPHKSEFNDEKHRRVILLYAKERHESWAIKLNCFYT
jgi:hypothetical protein